MTKQDRDERGRFTSPKNTPLVEDQNEPGKDYVNISVANVMPMMLVWSPAWGFSRVKSVVRIVGGLKVNFDVGYKDYRHGEAVVVDAADIGTALLLAEHSIPKKQLSITALHDRR